jgi:hypothetical protein
MFVISEESAGKAENDKSDAVSTKAEYFVSDKFAIKADFDDLAACDFSEGFLYTNKHTYLLQPRHPGAKEETITDNVQGYLPICSDSYVYRFIDSEKRKVTMTGLNSKETTSKAGKNLIHLAPPFNSRKIAQSTSSKSQIEFFLSRGTDRIVRVYPDYDRNIILIKLFNLTDVTPMGIYVWNLSDEGIEVLRPVNMNNSEQDKSEFHTFEVVVSPDGQHLLAV